MYYGMNGHYVIDSTTLRAPLFELDSMNGELEFPE